MYQLYLVFLYWMTSSQILKLRSENVLFFMEILIHLVRWKLNNNHLLVLWLTKLRIHQNIPLLLLKDGRNKQCGQYPYACINLNNIQSFKKTCIKYNWDTLLTYTYNVVEILQKILGHSIPGRVILRPIMVCWSVILYISVAFVYVYQQKELYHL